MIGLDSTAIIDFADGNKDLKRLLDKIKEPLAVNYISYFEIMLGIDWENENYKFEEDFYDNFFSSLSTLALDIPACKESSRIYWRLSKKRFEIGKIDCAIAGIYLSNGINKIITRNVKHFKRIKDVEVIGY